MADDLNDASTDIDKHCKKFISIMEKLCAKIPWESQLVIRSHVAAGGKRANSEVFPEKIRLKISANKKAHFRTPAQQAVSLTKKSNTCWGAHMSDKARHILVSANGGKFESGLRHVLSDKWHQELFKEAWVKSMKQAALVNFGGGTKWGKGDEFHVQLPGAKLKRTSAKANACLEEYLRLTRKKSRRKNTSFEKKYKKLLEKASKRSGITL